MTVVLIVGVPAWESVHTGRDGGSVPGSEKRRVRSHRPEKSAS